MSKVLLRGAHGGGWEIVIDDSTVVWDANLERAAVTALHLHLARESSEEIQLSANVPADILDVAQANVTSWALLAPPPSGRT